MSDHKALIEQAVAELTPGLANETQAWNLWNFLASDRGAIRAALLHAYSVDYAGLEAERDALRAQLDGMITETRIVRLDLRNGKIIESEPRFQRRLVGPWVEVTD